MSIDPFDPATRLLALLRTRRIGACELLDAFIQRIERLDGAINAVVVQDFERARERARMLDQMAPSGPLHGLPMTVKESFDVAGLPTTLGFPDRLALKVPTTALPVERLESAGAIVFGKTNVPVALADWQSANPVYGVTRNPWNPDWSPGGSSGGAAAALAAGLTPLELGSDIGGSLRQPAHACGIFAHKPTFGLVPRRPAMGQLPVAVDIAVSGPMARTAADLAVAMDVLAGPDPAATRLRFDLPAGPATLAGLKIAIWAEDAQSPTDPCITAALQGLAPRLEQAGAIVDIRARPAVDPGLAMALFLRLLVQPLSLGQDPALMDAKRAEFAELFARFPLPEDPIGISHQAWLKLDAMRNDLTRRYMAFFNEWDVLLCPAFSLPAQPHLTGEQKDWRMTIAGREIGYSELLFWPALVGLCGLPATAAPLGMSAAGQPFGMQIVGPPHGDRITLAVAGLLEPLGQAFQPPPGFA